MADINLIRSASSIAITPNPIQLPTVNVGVEPVPPDRVLPTVAGGVNGTATPERTGLAYPLDIVSSNHFMSFDIYEYSRTSLTTIGTLKKLVKGVNNIRMPLSEELVDNTQAQWDSRAKVGTVMGGAINTLAPGIQDYFNGKNSSFPVANFAGFGLLAGASAALNWMAGLSPGAAQTGTQSVPALMGLLGLSPNQFFTVLYVGPEYKRHRLTWHCSPRTFTEADELRMILKTFKNRMSPNRIANDLLWSFPKIFWIAIYNNSKFMYKFKPAVLETFTVNYAPGGRPAFYRDTMADGSNSAPEGVHIQAQFLELEYWLDGNITDSNDPFDVYTPAEYDGIGADWDMNKFLEHLANIIKQINGSFEGKSKEEWIQMFKERFPSLSYLFE